MVKQGKGEAMDARIARLAIFAPPSLEKRAAVMPEILLAEDNPSDVYLIRIALQEHGIELPLQVVADGGEVLRII